MSSTGIGLPAFRPRLASSQRSEFEHLARRLENSLDALCRSAIQRLDEQAEPVAASRLRTEEGRDLLREGLATQLRSFRRDSLPERPPDFVEVLVREAALGDDLDVALSGQRVAHMVSWDSWFALVEDRLDLEPGQRRELLNRGSEFFFRYSDRLSDYILEAYQRQATRGSGNREQRRLQAIRALLDGDAHAAASIDLDLDLHHLGLIAWGEEPEAAARELALALGRPLLVVDPDGREASRWAWISGTRPLDPLEQRRLKKFSPTRGCLALGFEGYGPPGFSASHRQALRAERFAGEGVVLVHYQDIVLQALASENEPDARAFVANELRGIEDDSTASRRIRETLSAYFASEYNAASAAAALGVHQQTVANRLRSAEERLGYSSIGARRVELEMALRLRATLSVPE